MLTIISFLGVLMMVIIAHELGHFVTAKLSGVKVEEFGFFYPPRLFSVKRGDTAVLDIKLTEKLARLKVESVVMFIHALRSFLAEENSGIALS